MTQSIKVNATRANTMTVVGAASERPHLTQLDDPFETADAKYVEIDNVGLACRMKFGTPDEPGSNWGHELWVRSGKTGGGVMTASVDVEVRENTILRKSFGEHVLGNGLSTTIFPLSVPEAAAISALTDLEVWYENSNHVYSSGSGIARLEAVRFVCPSPGEMQALGDISLPGLAGSIGLAAMIGDGALTFTGSADAKGLGAMNANGQLTLSGIALVSALGFMQAIGSYKHSGAVSVHGVGDLQALASIIAQGNGVIQGLADLAAAGSISTQGTATYHSLGALSASGQLTTSGYALLRGLGQMQAAGSALFSGTADLTAAELIALGVYAFIANVVRQKFDLAAAGEGVSFDNEQTELTDAAHVRCKVVFFQSRPTSALGTYKKSGFAEVVVMLPAGIGTAAAETIITTIHAAFLNVDSQTVKFRVPGVISSGSRGNHWEIHLLCPFDSVRA